jgi:hypothetical protein
MFAALRKILGHKPPAIAETPGHSAGRGDPFGAGTLPPDLARGVLKALAPAEPKEPFLEAMADFCALAIHPANKAQIAKALLPILRQPAKQALRQLDEAGPGGRHGPPVRDEPFNGKHWRSAGEAAINLEAYGGEICKLNCDQLWKELMGALHRAEGGKHWPPSEAELKAPTTTVARLLRAWADHSDFDLDQPKAIVSWVASTITSSNGRFFMNAATMAAMNALVGADAASFAHPSARKNGVGAVYLDAVKEGHQFQSPAGSGQELVSRLIKLFEHPDKTHRTDTLWGLMDQRDAFGSCPGKKLSRLVMNVFAEELRRDPAAFLARAGTDTRSKG